MTAAHIGVTAKDGVVTLSGHVENFMNKYAAERAARRVQGVKAVAEEIQVQLPFDKQRTDEQIAAAIVERFAWNVSAPMGAIQVIVEKGVVTLSGEVQWHYQKEAAQLDVQHLHGVMGVLNMITMKPQVDVKTIGEDIKSALKRSWYTRPDSISVSATSGKVKLSGIVHSPHPRYVAGATAWNAPGTISVETISRSSDPAKVQSLEAICWGMLAWSQPATSGRDSLSTLDWNSAQIQTLL